LFICLASLLLFVLFWSPRIRTSTQWFKSEVHSNTDKALPYTAAIVYLISLSRVSELLESLAFVHRNLPGHPWPVVLFHTGDFDHDTARMDFMSHLQDYIGAENGSTGFSERVEFVKLDWQLPKGISVDKEIVKPVDSYRWPGRLTVALLPPKSRRLTTSRLPSHVLILRDGNIL
jgi:mannosyltransferase